MTIAELLQSNPDATVSVRETGNWLTWKDGAWLVLHRYFGGRARPKELYRGPDEAQAVDALLKDK